MDDKKQQIFVECPRCKQVRAFYVNPDQPGKFGECSKCLLDFHNNTKLRETNRFYYILKAEKHTQLLCSCSIEAQQANYWRCLVVFPTFDSALVFTYQCEGCLNRKNIKIFPILE